jgi:hypothetical protein
MYTCVVVIYLYSLFNRRITLRFLSREDSQSYARELPDRFSNAFNEGFAVGNSQHNIPLAWSWVDESLTP